MNPKQPTENQTRVFWFALTALAVAIIIGVGSGLIWGIGKILNLLSPVLWPLAIAAVLAYLFDPPVNWLERKKIPRTWGIVIVFVVAISLLGGILASVIPQLIDETGQLVSKIPSLTTQTQKKIEAWTAEASSNPSERTTNSISTNAPPLAANSKTNSTPDAKMSQVKGRIISSAADWLGNITPKISSWILAQLAKAASLIDVFIAIILIPVYTFYFLREKRGIKSHWTQYLPLRESHTKDEIVFILTAINRYMIAFFRGQVLVSICSGILYTIGFLAIGLDYAFLLGFLAALLTMIPFLGAIINCVIALILAAMQYEDWLHPLLVLVIFAIVQSLESFLYSPKIMGKRVGLHPVIIIIAVMVGVTLFGGVLGGVLAIPLAAALRVMMFRYVWKKNEAA
jgi:predicted PurR-regulated permease PerM